MMSLLSERLTGPGLPWRWEETQLLLLHYLLLRNLLVFNFFLLLIFLEQFYIFPGFLGFCSVIIQVFNFFFFYECISKCAFVLSIYASFIFPDLLRLMIFPAREIPLAFRCINNLLSFDSV